MYEREEGRGSGEDGSERERRRKKEHLNIANMSGLRLSCDGGGSNVRNLLGAQAIEGHTIIQ